MLSLSFGIWYGSDVARCDDDCLVLVVVDDQTLLLYVVLNCRFDRNHIAGIAAF